ncbi:unnamed protein product [Bursaphelenchus okinawaensis]|uniref:Fungal lipase-type domain-containing protein n=1 Tax=Bursaphelenchus okinawaensis TaxID=465554 RepID=A0A811JQH0_9BILA|nr:unnamed protein product [Bursaphelenchus okinawaensis]CAG9078441.1 unnamed protein product [Bursaphelenchus okinawaensis]
MLSIPYYDSSYCYYNYNTCYMHRKSIAVLSLPDYYSRYYNYDYNTCFMHNKSFTMLSLLNYDSRDYHYYYNTCLAPTVTTTTLSICVTQPCLCYPNLCTTPAPTTTTQYICLSQPWICYPWLYTTTTTTTAAPNICVTQPWRCYPPYAPTTTTTTAAPNPCAVCRRCCTASGVVISWPGNPGISDDIRLHENGKSGIPGIGNSTDRVDNDKKSQVDNKAYHGENHHVGASNHDVHKNSHHDEKPLKPDKSSSKATELAKETGNSDRQLIGPVGPSYRKLSGVSAKSTKDSKLPKDIKLLQDLGLIQSPDQVEVFDLTEKADANEYAGSPSITKSIESNSIIGVPGLPFGIPEAATKTIDSTDSTVAVTSLSLGVSSLPFEVSGLLSGVPNKPFDVPNLPPGISEAQLKQAQTLLGLPGIPVDLSKLPELPQQPPRNPFETPESTLALPTSAAPKDHFYNVYQQDKEQEGSDNKIIAPEAEESSEGMTHFEIIELPSNVFRRSPDQTTPVLSTIGDIQMTTVTNVVLLITSLLLCDPATAVYNEFLSRSKFFPLAAAAYSDQPEQCIKNKLSNATLIAKYRVPCDSNENDYCFGFIALSHKDKAIIISFRGSETQEQVIREGLDTLVKPPVPEFNGTKVSYYFNNAFQAIWTGGMKEQFEKLAKQFPSYKIWITGHSLGGAMASVCAAEIAYTHPSYATRIMLYTYGQPRTGDQAFAEFIDRHIKQSYRIINNRDIVVNLPLANPNRFWHHKLAVIYKKEMNIGSEYVTCTESDIKCATMYFTGQTSVLDHVFYYNVRVSDYGENGCKFNRNVRVDTRNEYEEEQDEENELKIVNIDEIDASYEREIGQDLNRK